MIAVLAATALVAMLLAACGSGSDSSSTSGSATTEAGAQDNGSGGGTHGENDSGEGQQEAADSFTAEEVEEPLEVSGGGSEQFRIKGGDNSIQEFGEEGDESELQEAAEAVHGFFVTRATGDWEGACGYLSKSMTEQLEQLAKSSTQLESKDCAPFLQAFTSRLSASQWRDTTVVDAGSLRQEGEQAFLIYYGAGKTAYAMPLKVEDGQFKVGGLSGNPLG